MSAEDLRARLEEHAGLNALQADPTMADLLESVTVQQSVMPPAAPLSLGGLDDTALLGHVIIVSRQPEQLPGGITLCWETRQPWHRIEAEAHRELAGQGWSESPDMAHFGTRRPGFRPSAGTLLWTRLDAARSAQEQLWLSSTDAEAGAGGGQGAVVRARLQQGPLPEPQESWVHEAKERARDEDARNPFPPLQPATGTHALPMLVAATSGVVVVGETLEHVVAHYAAQLEAQRWTRLSEQRLLGQLLQCWQTAHGLLAVLTAAVSPGEGDVNVQLTVLEPRDRPRSGWTFQYSG